MYYFIIHTNTVFLRAWVVVMQRRRGLLSLIARHYLQERSPNTLNHTIKDLFNKAINYLQILYLLCVSISTLVTFFFQLVSELLSGERHRSSISLTWSGRRRVTRFGFQPNACVGVEPTFCRPQNHVTVSLFNHQITLKIQPEKKKVITTYPRLLTQCRRHVNKRSQIIRFLLPEALAKR